MANRRIIDAVLSSSDDEDFFVHRRPKVVRRRINHFEEFDDIDFRGRFRLSKENVVEVLQQIRHDLEHRREQNHAISPMNQLLLALRFYATGSHFISAGDFSGVSKTSTHRIVHKVTTAIARLRPYYIKFPTMPNKTKQRQLKFFNIARFPRVLGSLDCTHIKIQSLGGNYAEVFRNRKGYFSINVQAVCNANLEFSDIVARWPGSVHDCTIFNNSRIRALFEANTFGDGLLLGDSGYQLRSYIMTPLGNPMTPSEQLYNESLIRTQNTIERTFGVWKRRFPVLALGSRFQKMDTLLAMIVATAVLHNIARRVGELLPPDDPTLQLPAPWEQILEEGLIRHEVNRQHRNRVQNIMQNSLINGYFQSLIK